MNYKHYREPVKHTCPDIDKVIDVINRCIKNCEPKIGESEEDLLYRLDAIRHDLWGIDDILEKLRAANDELRQWGIEEADEVDRLSYYVSELELKLEPEKV
jgi:hypothetical protein